MPPMSALLSMIAVTVMAFCWDCPRRSPVLVYAAALRDVSGNAFVTRAQLNGARRMGRYRADVYRDPFVPKFVPPQPDVPKDVRFPEPDSKPEAQFESEPELTLEPEPEPEPEREPDVDVESDPIPIPEPEPPPEPKLALAVAPEPAVESKPEPTPAPVGQHVLVRGILASPQGRWAVLEFEDGERLIVRTGQVIAASSQVVTSITDQGVTLAALAGKADATSQPDRTYFLEK